MRILSVALPGALALCLLTAPLMAQEYEADADAGLDIAVWDTDADAWSVPLEPGTRMYLQAWDHADVRNAERFIVAGVLNPTQLELLNAVIDAHTDFVMHIEPSGEMFHVHSMLDRTQLDRMMGMHREAGLALPLRVMPLSADEGVVAGWSGRAGTRGWRGQRRLAHRGAHRGYGRGHGSGRHGARFVHGAHGCTPWAKDWHQRGCGVVHVHNLADWLPGHPGYRHGWHYAGWDHSSWPHVRGDGSHVWYTGEFALPPMTPPVWFDAEWVAFGRGYPDRFWLGTHHGRGWKTHGGWCGRAACPRSRCRCRW